MYDYDYYFFVADQFLRSHLPHTESVFRGMFTVTEGDYLPAGVAEIGSYVHIEKARFYQHKLDLVFTGSPLAQKYVHNEVFLLEGYVYLLIIAPPLIPNNMAMHY